MNKQELKEFCSNVVEIIEKAEMYDNLVGNEDLIVIPKSKLIEKIEFRSKDIDLCPDEQLNRYVSVCGKLVVGHLIKIINYEKIEDLSLELQQSTKEIIVDNIVSQLGGKYLK